MASALWFEHVSSLLLVRYSKGRVRGAVQGVAEAMPTGPHREDDDGSWFFIGGSMLLPLFALVMRMNPIWICIGSACRNRLCHCDFG